MNLELLRKTFKGDIENDNSVREKYSHDASLFEVVPEVVVFPKDGADVEAVVRFVSEEKKNNPNISVTARSAGTDMSGGPLNESIILDTTRYLNKIVSVDEQKGIV
ncbi:MAG: FAD-binding protein, partial [Patescibacteria group bacterium]